MTIERARIRLDGYTPALGFLRRYVYALHTCAVASEPLGSEALTSIGWHGREIVLEAARTGHTFLLTPDNRVLCRGLFRYGFRDSLAPVKLLTRKSRVAWPLAGGRRRLKYHSFGSRWGEAAHDRDT